MIIVSLYQK